MELRRTQLRYRRIPIAVSVISLDLHHRLPRRRQGARGADHRRVLAHGVEHVRPAAAPPSLPRGARADPQLGHRAGVASAGPPRALPRRPSRLARFEPWRRSTSRSRSSPAARRPPSFSTTTRWPFSGREPSASPCERRSTGTAGERPWCACAASSFSGSVARSREGARRRGGRSRRGRRRTRSRSPGGRGTRSPRGRSRDQRAGAFRVRRAGVHPSQGVRPLDLGGQARGHASAPCGEGADDACGAQDAQLSPAPGVRGCARRRVSAQIARGGTSPRDGDPFAVMAALL